MSEIFNFVQANGQIIAAAVLGLAWLVILFNQLRLLRQGRRMNDQMTDITEKVGSYLAAVMEDEEEDGLPMNHELQQKTHNDEAQTQIISSVLQEIFP